MLDKQSPYSQIEQGTTSADLLSRVESRARVHAQREKCDAKIAPFGPLGNCWPCALPKTLRSITSPPPPPTGLSSNWFAVSLFFKICPSYQQPCGRSCLLLLLLRPLL